MWLAGGSRAVGVGVQDLYAMRGDSVEEGGAVRSTHAQEQSCLNNRCL